MNNTIHNNTISCVSPQLNVIASNYVLIHMHFKTVNLDPLIIYAIC